MRMSLLSKVAEKKSARVAALLEFLCIILSVKVAAVIQGNKYWSWFLIIKPVRTFFAKLLRNYG